MRKVKLIVHETYQGKRKTEDVFATEKVQKTDMFLYTRHSLCRKMQI